MISVKAYYKEVKTVNDVKIYYKKVQVTGHANSGNIESIKVCAGVTAILGGFTKVVYGIYDRVELSKGIFSYRVYEGTRYNQLRETEIQLDLVITQLYEIYRCYPHLFTEFELIKER